LEKKIKKQEMRKVEGEEKVAKNKRKEMDGREIK
jgi:hypothetical protein